MNSPHSTLDFPISDPASVQRILIARFGLLGDHLVSVPALWRLRSMFPNAELHLLSENHTGKINAKDVLEGSGLIDSIHLVDMRYRRFLYLFNQLKTTLPLRKIQWDFGIVLSSKNPPNTQRTYAFYERLLKFANVKRILKPKEPRSHQYDSNGFLKKGMHETDSILELVEKLGTHSPDSCTTRTDLNLSETELSDAREWIEQKGLQGKRLLAMGVGANMPINKWPIERYQSVVDSLIESHDVYPILFGGAGDRAECGHLVKAWQRGALVLGKSIRFCSALMTHCDAYLGNDTGTTHLAAASGVKCVAAFSSRTAPGHWHPYSKGSIVFRTTVACEGCELRKCTFRRSKCIRSIGADEVLEAVTTLLNQNDG